MSIPDAVQAAGVGSFITLVGVWFLNHGNTDRQLEQLRHDREERDKERRSQLRRELYQQALVELQRVNRHLISLPQLDLMNVDIADGLQDFFALAAKVQLVAEPPTALLVNSLTEAYGTLIFESLELLLPIAEAKVAADGHERDWVRINADVERLDAEIRAEMESRAPNATRLTALRTQKATRQTDEFIQSQSRAESFQEYQTACAPFRAMLFDRVSGLTSTQFRVLDAFRRELGITGDLSQIETQAAMQIEQYRAKMLQLTAKLSPWTGTK